MPDYNKPKISKKEMIEEIQGEFIIYFKNGLISPKTFFDIDKIKFNNIHDILNIHFILSDEVQRYTLELEGNIRNIKNSTRQYKKLYHGEVRGNIDWNKTIEYRSNTFYGDRTKFVCDNVDKLYDIKENLVLKKTISIIYNIIHSGIGMDRFNEEPWYKNGQAMSNIISNVYKKNVYIEKTNITKIKITDKIIFDVLNSRNKIYRDSAKLLKLYRDIMDFDKKEMEKLFSKTFIDMQDENKVFELYSIFKYIRNNFPQDKVKYNILDGKEDMLAKLEDEEYIYEFYHDRIGRNDISFNIDGEEIEASSNSYLKRKLKVLDKKALIYKELKKKDGSSSIWSGRPDLLIFKIDKENDTIKNITIGEIKYTNNIDYMFAGLEELLEYIFFVKDENDIYIDDVSIKGLLFVDNISIEKKEFKDIKIETRSIRKKD